MSKEANVGGVGGWYRMRIGPLSRRPKEWRDVILRVLLPVIKALESNGDLIRFFFLTEAAPEEKTPHIMFVFFGNVDSMLHELHNLKCQIMPDDETGLEYQVYDPASESYRFLEDFMLGIALWELGCRFALAAWEGKRPTDQPDPKRPAHAIIDALWHRFRAGVLLEDDPHDPKSVAKITDALTTLYDAFTRPQS